MERDSPLPAATASRGWLIALGLWLLLTAIACVALWRLRGEAQASEMRELRVLSLALTDEIERGLQGAEAGLHAVRIEVSKGRLRSGEADTQRALRTRADLMPAVRSLWLVAADGTLLSASDSSAPPMLGSFSPALAQLGLDTPSVSRPFVDAASGESRVALAVRLDDAPAASAGWIVASMPATALLGAFSAALPAADARMAVFRRDGVRLVGAPAAALVVDEAVMAQRLASQPDMRLRRASDGTDRLVTLHGVRRYELEVLLSRDLEASLQGWRQTAQITAVGIVLLLLTLAVSVHLVQRADRRRAEAQGALQAQRTRASKLQSLGTLAGGVAHDFNNVLAAIVGFGEMAQDAAPPGSAQARHLDKVLQAAMRGKALVERILAFSRGGARAASVFELQPVVAEVLALLAGSLRAGVVLEQALEARGACVRGDATQAFEAVMNLCTNAMQAMPGGGMLSVHLQRLRVAETRVLSHSLLPPGEYLALSVADQGEGITPAVMERLFEPFFTTRAAQSGTGLGLAVVHGVLAEFGGAIDVRSVVGQGARFTLYFPQCHEAADLAAPAEPTLPAGAGQALLVVDDDPTLVELAEALLRGLGYQPVGHSDPAAALQALTDEPQRYAALITDEVMPGLSGTQLTARLRALDLRLPVLLVSGYGGASLAARAAEAGVSRVLSKPLRRAELARALAELVA